MTRTLPIDELAWSADALDRLGELHQAREMIDWMIERAVIECRTDAVHINGVETDHLHGGNRELRSYEPFSWERIAKQLGVTRKVAWRKYGHLIS
jgi:hypothetical protein